MPSLISQFELRLSHLIPTENSIRSTARWMLAQSPDQAPRLVQCWNTEFRAAPADRKTTFLLLVNEILQSQSIEKKQPFEDFFGDILVAAFRHAMSNMRDHKGQRQIARIVQVLQDRRILSEKLLEELAIEVDLAGFGFEKERASDVSSENNQQNNNANTNHMTNSPQTHQQGAGSIRDRARRRGRDRHRHRHRRHGRSRTRSSSSGRSSDTGASVSDNDISDNYDDASISPASENNSDDGGFSSDSDSDEIHGDPTATRLKEGTAHSPSNVSSPRRRKRNGIPIPTVKFPSHIGRIFEEFASAKDLDALDAIFKEKVTILYAKIKEYRDQIEDGDSQKTFNCKSEDQSASEADKKTDVLSHLPISAGKCSDEEPKIKSENETSSKDGESPKVVQDSKGVGDDIEYDEIEVEIDVGQAESLLQNFTLHLKAKLAARKALEKLLSQYCSTMKNEHAHTENIVQEATTLIRLLPRLGKDIKEGKFDTTVKASEQTSISKRPKLSNVMTVLGTPASQLRPGNAASPNPYSPSMGGAKSPTPYTPSHPSVGAASAKEEKSKSRFGPPVSETTQQSQATKPTAYSPSQAASAVLPQDSGRQTSLAPRYQQAQHTVQAYNSQQSQYRPRPPPPPLPYNNGRVGANPLPPNGSHRPVHQNNYNNNSSSSNNSPRYGQMGNDRSYHKPHGATRNAYGRGPPHAANAHFQRIANLGHGNGTRHGAHLPPGQQYPGRLHSEQERMPHQPVNYNPRGHHPGQYHQQQQYRQQQQQHRQHPYQQRQQQWARQPRGAPRRRNYWS